MILKDFKLWHAPNVVKIPNSQKILIKHLSIYEIIDFYKSIFLDKGVKNIDVEWFKNFLNWTKCAEKWIHKHWTLIN
ncbi:MAG: hypothetical protein LBR15_10790 [Methanobrevibacter sp.]|jgi:hypothetical protein|nr:hypothetical protein [Candidatus Methanovirga australis]